ASDLSYDINTIGYNWKYYDNANMVYVIEDSLVYFVKTNGGSVYKIRFTNYKSANVESVFGLTDLGTGIENVNHNSSLVIYPNPASDLLSVIDFENSLPSRYKVFNVAGQ